RVGRAAVPPPARGRSAGHPLLHAEPLDLDRGNPRAPAPRMRALALLLLTAPAFGAMIPATVPADVSTGPVIADIIIQRDNVFDPNVPGEDIWMFQTANKIHFV